MDVQALLLSGQHQARTRWNTHESGTAFDCKKTLYLTEQAQKFIAQQALCVIAGPGSQHELCGLLTMSEPGFVQTPDSHTCILQIDSQFRASRLIQGLQHSSQNGQRVQLGLFFICHPTRERLCVQGSAHLLPGHVPGYYRSSGRSEPLKIYMQVQEAFFHCAKYIKTRIAGLTSPIEPCSRQRWYPQYLRDYNEDYLSNGVRAFIEEQVLCFICTRNQAGQCAVNHRGGAAGFLVTSPPDTTSLGGTIFLPDYAGNGAFKAIGNILETGQVTLVIPTYAAQLAVCVSGSAYIMELEELPSEVAQRCVGAKRVVAIAAQRVETQYGDWSTALAYERARAESHLTMYNSSDTYPFLRSLAS